MRAGDMEEEEDEEGEEAVVVEAWEGSYRRWSTPSLMPSVLAAGISDG
jgi:hypothetical protein